MRFLITGASGFVGGHAATHFLAKGETVRALVRRPGTAPLGCEEVVGDLREHGSFARVLEGVDVVLHLGARVHVLREREGDPLAHFRAVNVEPTRALAESASQHGVRHFVFLSSVGVAGLTTEAPLTERDPCRPQSPYGRSKLEAERAIEEISARTALPVTSLRPPLVYGPGAPANIARLFQLVDRRVPLPFASVRNARSYVGVRNLVHALDAVVAAGARATGPMYVSDGRDLSTEALVRLIAQALERRPILLPLPMAPLRALGRLGDLVRGVVPAPVTTRRLDQLFGSMQVSSDLLRSRTNYVAPVAMEEELVAAARWYRRHGFPGGRPAIS